MFHKQDNEIMIESTYLLSPILGGIIGYITNDIAIRMLFRPHSDKYLFGIHVPFTPGIIPKEKDRIADAIGNIVSENLMNKEVLSTYLLSESMLHKVRTSVERFIEEQKNREDTVSDFISRFLGSQNVLFAAKEMKVALSDQITFRLQESSLGSKIAHIAVEHVLNDMKINGIAGITMIVVRPFLSILQEPAENALAKNINIIIKNNSKEIVSTIVDEETQIFLSKSMRDVLAVNEKKIIKIVNIIEDLYINIIKGHLPQLLDSIDICRVIRERIKEMDINETEEMIFQIMDKELKAIVWLGAGLGMLMGCINCFIY